MRAPLSTSLHIHIQTPPTGYVGPILHSIAVATASWNIFEVTMRVLLYATVTGDTAHAVAAKYPPSTQNDTPTCSGYSSAALYETHVANQDEFGRVHK